MAFSLLFAIYPNLAVTAATRPLKCKKGGKISPAAKRFPQSPFRETEKPPLFVPVFRNVFHNLCDGQSIGFCSVNDCSNNVRSKVVQAKYPRYIRWFQAELCHQVCDVLCFAVDELKRWKLIVTTMWELVLFEYVQQAKSRRI